MPFVAVLLLAAFAVPPFVLGGIVAAVSAVALRGKLPWLSVLRGGAAAALGFAGEVAGAIIGAVVYGSGGANKPAMITLVLGIGGLLGAVVGGFTARWAIKTAYRVSRWAAVRSGVGVASDFDVFR